MSLFCIDLPVERHLSGEWIDGRYKKCEPRNLTVKAAPPQPLTANQILLLPESRRTQEAVSIFTKERLFTSDEGEQRPADVVCWDGKRFEIHGVKNYGAHGNQSHYECVGIKIDGQGRGSEE